MVKKLMIRRIRMMFIKFFCVTPRWKKTVTSLHHVTISWNDQNDL